MHKKTNTFIIWVTLLSVVYAIVRYHLFKGFPFSQFIDIFNKGISLAGIILIGLSLSLGPLSRRFPSPFRRLEPGKRLFGIWGFILAFIHSLLSLLIFDPNHYEILFSFLSVNSLGEYVMVTGFISLLLIGAAFLTSFPLLYSFRLKTFTITQFAGYIGCIVAGLHVFPIGVNGWTNLSTWPGNLVPITLISFIVVLVTVILRTFSTFLPSYRKGKP